MAADCTPCRQVVEPPPTRRLDRPRIAGVSGDRKPRGHRQDVRVTGLTDLEGDGRAGLALERREGQIAILGELGAVIAAARGAGCQPERAGIEPWSEMVTSEHVESFPAVGKGILLSFEMRSKPASLRWW